MHSRKNTILLLMFMILILVSIFCTPTVAADEIPTADDYEWGGEYAMVLPDTTGTLAEFSEDHPALDLTSESGAAVLAADEGVVNAVQTEDAPLTETSAAYGNMIRIVHPDGNQTLYAHLDTILISDGDTVSRGQRIGTVGTTGDTEEPTLHFEVIEPLANTDPTPYLTGVSTYTQASLSSIKKDLSGGTKYISDYGTIDRAAVVNELQSHEDDKYYLNTPYHGGDWQSPTGDTSYNGKAGMNCAGFISYVLRKCGLDSDKVIDTIKETRYFDWESGRPYSILSGASNYYLWASNGDLVCYAYNSMDDLLEAGKAAKGDLILYYVNQGWLLSGIEDNHLVFFWGDTPSEDLVWHQANIGITDAKGNTTNQIIPSTYYIDSAKYILIKMDETGYNTPEAPKVTAKNDTETGKIVLTWDAVEDAAKYEIFRASSKNGTYYKMTPTSKTTYTSKSITPGQTYYYKVRAVAADGTVSAYSDIVSRTCKLATPVVTASNVASTGKIKLAWRPIEGAVKYEIYRSKSQGGKYTKLNTITDTTYWNVSIDAGTKYYYKVRAVASDGTVSAYTTVSRTCKLAQPKVTASNLSNGKIQLTWAKVEGATQYQIYRATSKNGKYYKMSPTTDTSYKNISIDPGKKYYYRVQALCGNSAAASAKSSIVSATCKLPSTTVTIGLNKNGKPRLTWKSVNGAVQYEIYRATSKNGKYYKMSPTTGTSYTNPSAKSETKYYYKVRAIHSNSAATSAFSSVVSIKSK